MTRRFSIIKSRADAFCAKLNDGLAAVAVVLAMVVVMVGTYRTVELVQLTAQDDFAAGAPLDPQQDNH
jgi:hypothetical protein